MEADISILLKTGHFYFALTLICRLPGKRFYRRSSYKTNFSGLATLQKLLNQGWAGVTCRPSCAAFFLRNSICCWRFLRS